MAERLSDPAGKDGKVGLNLAGPQAVVNQPQEPLGQISVKGDAGFGVKQGNQRLVELEHSVRIADLPRRLELGQLLGPRGLAS